MMSEIEETNDNEAAWIEYRKAVYENQCKSQDDFEKYINIIAPGALGLTLTFFDKIIPIDKAIYVPLIILGWLLLTLTILSNLFSHHFAARISEKTIKHIDERNYDETEKCSKVGNRKINIINLISIISLFLGIFLIVVFASINFYTMSNDKPTPRPYPTPLPGHIERGRVVPSPPPSRPTPPPKTNN